jgi:hypothetical protein
MSLQSWDEHRENHDALMRKLERDGAMISYFEMQRWRRRFWWLLVLSALAIAYLLVALVKN